MGRVLAHRRMLVQGVQVVFDPLDDTIAASIGMTAEAHIVGSPFHPNRLVRSANQIELD